MLTNTRHVLRPRVLLAVATVGAAAAALIGAPLAAATPAPTNATPTPQAAPASGPTAQGIIMRDGGVCDPIRHMGC